MEGDLTKLASGFTSANGPVFSRIGYLLFSDGNTIHKWQDGAVTVFRDAPNSAAGLTFDHQGRLLVCERDRLTRDGKTMAKGHGPLDVVYAIDGNIYFCDGKAVHRVGRDGRLVPATSDVTAPRAVALAPKQQKLYVTGSNTQVFAIHADGSLDKGQAFADVKGAGLKTDESGRVWIATPAGIQVIAANGSPVKTIALPEEPTNLNWGAGFRNLIVTSRTSVYRIEARTNGTRTY